MRRDLAVFVAVSVLGVACASPERQAEIPAELSQYVLDRAPEIEHRKFVDFGGKVHLLGFDVEPSLARPDSEMSITLYWKCVGEVGEGWNLFTHLLDDRGQPIGNYDDKGPLRVWGSDRRQALSPSLWEPGNVYVDQQTIHIPKHASGRVTLVTGLWQNDVRLPVLSGSVHSQNAGIVAHFETGVEPAKRRGDGSLAQN